MAHMRVLSVWGWWGSSGGPGRAGHPKDQEQSFEECSPRGHAEVRRGVRKEKEKMPEKQEDTRRNTAPDGPD